MADKKNASDGQENQDQNATPAPQQASAPAEQPVQSQESAPEQVAPVQETVEETQENADSVAEQPQNTDTDTGAALTQGEKMLAAIGYVSFLCILPLVMKPNSKFCQFHGKQALMVLIIFLLFSWLGWFGFFFAIVLKLAHIMVALLGVITAFQGQKFSIPIIGDMSKKLDFK